MALDPATVKQITDDLEATYQQMNQAATSLDVLLAAGQATCDEVQVYNLWVLATYQLQKGMLDTLRAGGQQVANAPPDPRLYAWNGVDGSQAYNFDCSGQASSLSGAMARALKGPTPTSRLISFNEVSAINKIPLPAAGTTPSFAQMANGQLNGLGALPVVAWIIIAAVTYLLVKEVADALGAYLTENAIQTETTNRTKVQAAAYADFVKARAACLAAQTAGGATPAAAAASCASMVPAPQIVTDAARAAAGTSFWSWLGIITASGVGGIALLAYIKHKYTHGDSAHEA